MTRTSRAMGVLATTSLLATGGAWGLHRLRTEARRTLYPAPRPPAPLKIPEGWQVLGSPDEGYLTVHSPPPTRGAPTIVYCHGNAQEVATQLAAIPQTLRRAGFGVAVIEYPGYGPLSATECHEDRLLSSALRSARAVQASPGVNEILLVGLSLGTAVATYLASEGIGERLLLAAPLTSAVEATRALAGEWVPARLLLGPERLDNRARAPHITIPTLLISGEHDELFPPAMGRRLAEAFPDAHFMEVPAATHQTIRDHIPAALEVLLTTPASWPDHLPPHGRERHHDSPRA